MTMRESRPPLSGHSSGEPSGASVSRSASTQASAPSSSPRWGSISAHGHAGRSTRVRPRRRPIAACGARRLTSANGVRVPTGYRSAMIAAQASQSTESGRGRRLDERVDPGREVGRAALLDPVHPAQARDRAVEEPAAAADDEPAGAEPRRLLPACGGPAPHIALDPGQSALALPLPLDRVAIEHQDRALVLVDGEHPAAQRRRPSRAPGPGRRIPAPRRRGGPGPARRIGSLARLRARSAITLPSAGPQARGGIGRLRSP